MAVPAQASSILFYKSPTIPFIPTYTEIESEGQLRTVSRIMTEAEFTAIMNVGAYTETTIRIDIGDLIITTGSQGEQTAIYTAIYNPEQTNTTYVQTWSIYGPLGLLLTPSEVS